MDFVLKYIDIDGHYIFIMTKTNVKLVNLYSFKEVAFPSNSGEIKEIQTAFVNSMFNRLALVP